VTAHKDSIFTLIRPSYERHVVIETAKPGGFYVEEQDPVRKGERDSIVLSPVQRIRKILCVLGLKGAAKYRKRRGIWAWIVLIKGGSLGKPKHLQVFPRHDPLGPELSLPLRGDTTH
jgi:hypothetical protein